MLSEIKSIENILPIDLKTPVKFDLEYIQNNKYQTTFYK